MSPGRVDANAVLPPKAFTHTAARRGMINLEAKFRCRFAADAATSSCVHTAHIGSPRRWPNAPDPAVPSHAPARYGLSFNAKLFAIASMRSVSMLLAIDGFPAS